MAARRGSELRLVLLGENWKKKSAVGNLLLETDAFDLHKKSKNKSVKSSYQLTEKSISIINTPDLLLLDLEDGKQAELMNDAAIQSGPGPHAFLLVLQPEDFTEQHKTRLQSVLESFSEQAFHRSLVVISTARGVTPGSMQKHMSASNIRDMIMKCRYRYVWMQKPEDDPNMKDFKKKELLTRIFEMMENSDEYLPYQPFAPDAAPQQAPAVQTSETKHKPWFSTTDVVPRTRSGSYDLLQSDMSELRVVLLGNSWSQRSRVGNLLLKNDVFDAKRGSERPMRVGAPFNDKKISVTNTPDMPQPGITASRETMLIEEIGHVSTPGPHVFLLVLQPEDFTMDHKTSLQRVLESFGEQPFNHSLVLICTPREETLGFMQKYMNHASVNQMVRKCRFRYLWMTDFRDDTTMGTFFRGELLMRMGQMMKENSYEHLIYENFSDAAPQQAPAMQTSGTKHKPWFSTKDALRILLLGKSDDKKTKLMKFISNKQKLSEMVSGKWRGADVTVTKTPDLFSLSVENVIQTLKISVSLCPPGPNVLLLLVKPSEFTEKNRETLKFILRLFSSDAFNHSMVVITHDEMYNQCVNELLSDCEGRFYNISDENRQVLMEKMENIIELNKGSYLMITEKTDVKATNTAPSLNLVLCGRTGEGKRSVVQSILGRAECPAESCSGQCVKHEAEVCGRWVTLVELPALSEKPLETVMEQSLSCIALCGPAGVHVFILVLPVGPITDKDEAELQILQETFSSAVNVFTMILFTVDSDPTAPDVVNFVQRDSDVRELYRTCGGGYLIFSNRGEQPAAKLLDYVENIMAKNQLDSFTTETLARGHMENKFSVKRCGDDLRVDCLRIALIGKTGSGKSSSGNIILGRKEFEAKPSSSSVTRLCQKATCTRGDCHVTVVDTPGVFDTSLTHDQVNEEMLKCISLLAPGPHVILLVLPIGRVTEEEKKTLKLIKEGFGKGAERFTIILFTHGDKLVNDEMSIEDYIKTSDSSFNKLISDCGNRYHVFNNSDKKNDSQVEELLEKIKVLVRENGGSCYTNDMLQEAEAAIKKEMHRLLQEKEETIKREKEELEIKYHQEIGDMKGNMDRLKVELEKERIQRETDLKEKEEKIKEEQKQRKKEQEAREVEDRKRRQLEDEQRYIWERKTKTLEERIKSELISREESERKLEQSRRQMEMERELWEGERKKWWKKRKEEDEERQKMEQKRQEEISQIQKEKQQKEKELREKEVQIKEEQQLRMEELEKRDKEDRKRTEREDKQHQELIQKYKQLEEKIRSEEESKEATDMKLEQIRRKMEKEREQWEKERNEQRTKQKEEDEDRQQREAQMQKEKDQIAKEKVQIEKDLKEKQKLIKEEQELHQRELEKRDEEDGKRKEQEDKQRQEWEQNIQALKVTIDSEKESKEEIDRNLQHVRRQLEEEREQWEKERKEQEEIQKQEDEKWKQKIEKLQEEYDKERQDFQKRLEEDQSRREEEDKNRRELEQKYQTKIKEMEEEKEKYKLEARAEAEKHNAFQEKYTREFEQLNQQHKAHLKDKDEKYDLLKALAAHDERKKMEAHRKAVTDLVNTVRKNKEDVEKIHNLLVKQEKKLQNVKVDEKKKVLKENETELNELIQNLLKEKKSTVYNVQCTIL